MDEEKVKSFGSNWFYKSEEKNLTILYNFILEGDNFKHENLQFHRYLDLKELNEGKIISKYTEELDYYLITVHLNNLYNKPIPDVFLFHHLKRLVINDDYGDRSKFPETIFKNNGLEDLHVLMGKNIITVPDKFEHFPYLTEFGLSGINIENVPKSIKNLTQLREIYLTVKEFRTFNIDILRPLLNLETIFLGNINFEIDGNEILKEFVKIRENFPKLQYLILDTKNELEKKKYEKYKKKIPELGIRINESHLW